VFVSIIFQPEIRMPRQYKRQEGTRKYGYCSEAMSRAVLDVNENHMSVKKAAFLHDVNRTTLMNHLKNSHCGAVGRPTLLTPHEERLIVHAVQKLGDWGFGIDRSAVLDIVLDYLKNSDRPDVKPGIEWMYGFERRWKSVLTRRVAQPLPANRAYACNSHVVNDFFDKLAEIFDRLKLVTRPQNIFNVDETGFQTDVGSHKIFCKKGMKNPHKTVASSTKTMYTVQVCCSALGEFLPMYIVFKGKNLYDIWCQGGPDGAVYNCSPSGWMEREQFLQWFTKVFVTSTCHLEGTKLLIFDGHNSHLSTQVVDIAVKNDIELLCLPAHTSSILQPLDVGVFKAVKGAWRKCLREYYDESRYSNVDKRIFPSLLKQVVDGGAFSRTNAINAFGACGIFPLNREKITGDKLSTAVPLTHIATSDDVVPATSESPALPGDGKMQKQTSGSSEAQAPVLSPCVHSPRKRIETALLNHLRQVTPHPSEKRRRVKRTLAECLTSPEVMKRMKEDAGSSKMTNSTTDDVTSTPTTTKTIGAGVNHNNVHHVPAAVKKSKKQQLQSGQKHQKRQPSGTMLKQIPRGSNTSIQIRKPTWLTGRAGATEGQTPPGTKKTTENGAGKLYMCLELTVTVRECLM